MKKNSFTILTATTLAAAFCLSVTTYAASASPDKSIKEKIEASADEMIANLSGAEVFAADAAAAQSDEISYDIENAYEIRTLEAKPVSAYSKGGRFEDIITEEIKYNLPYSGGDMTFSAEGKFLGMTNDTVPVLYPSEVTALIAESLPDKNVSVTYTYSQLHTAVFVYIQDSDTSEEYIIPYMTVSVLDDSGMFDPDNNQSVPAAVYRMDDFMTAMQATFDENPPTKDEEGNQLYGQGVIQLDPNAEALFSLTPVVMSGQTDFPAWGWMLIGTGAILILGGTAFGVYTFRRKAEKISPLNA